MTPALDLQRIRRLLNDHLPPEDGVQAHAILDRIESESAALRARLEAVEKAARALMDAAAPSVRTWNYERQGAYDALDLALGGAGAGG